MYVFVCMYVGMYIWMHVYVYVCMYVYMYVCVWMHVCMCVCLNACMYVCMYVWINVYVYLTACMYVCISEWMYVCMYVCMSECIYVWMCVGMYLCMYVCLNVCVYVCMHACMSECVNVCMCVCIYVCILFSIYGLIKRLSQYDLIRGAPSAKNPKLWESEQKQQCSQIKSQHELQQEAHSTAMGQQRYVCMYVCTRMAGYFYDDALSSSAAIGLIAIVEIQSVETMWMISCWLCTYVSRGIQDTVCNLACIAVDCLICLNSIMPYRVMFMKPCSCQVKCTKG